MNFGALIIGGFFMLIGWLVSNRLKNKFREYSQVQLTKNLTGAEIARLMLADSGIHDVKVICVEGQLTDHYNPADKTLTLATMCTTGAMQPLPQSHPTNVAMPCNTLLLTAFYNCVPLWYLFKT